MAESFTTTNRYFDNKHYPRGFSRHGDFTIKVWSKYMTRIKRPKRFHTLSGGKPQVEGAEDYTDSDD